MFLSSKIKGIASAILLSQSLSIPLLANEQILEEENIVQGELVELSEEGISIVAPKGWEILKKFAGQRLYLREPKKPGKIDYDKPQFQRNITLAVSYEGTPVDDKQFDIIREKMMNTFAKAAGVEAYTIAEKAQYFDYKAKKDGMIIQSSFFLNGFPMTQVHIYVSNKEKNVLVSYTDLTESFEANPSAYDEAWSSITSINLDGDAVAGRYDDLIKKASLFGPIIVLILAVIFFFRYRAKRRYGDHMLSEASFLNDSLLDEEVSHSKIDSDIDSNDEDEWVI